jgi:hypothetical protein
MKPNYRVNKRTFDSKGFNLEKYLNQKLEKIITEVIKEEIKKHRKNDEK